ncbi:MAG TPA: 16S rRNA (cytosine(1402)-N(4))-methyltransferase RsmH [Syntrophales bacterium]|jgi:16S rRNA (cytosine1402-N4)-methyltransferase|nr:16S rRNA (cytosine(1402)-N(4))-methyltransferase RsmH [Syntrophales bacterium]
MAAFHQPVLLEEALALLNCRSGGIYVDGTVGGGGHARAILEGTSPDGLIVGIDRDDEALREASRVLAPFGPRVILAKGSFADLRDILAAHGIGPVQGILLDLGVSSHQLDTAERGFSFSLEGPLDMRMDPSSGPSARDLIRSAREDELASIFREFGEERFARRIARAIIEHRRREPIENTVDLAALIARVVPGGAREERRIHPATRVFQALRIAVNRELDHLERGLREGIETLAPGGRMAVISFHSLEDRLVKETFRSWEKTCTCPPGIPVCTCRTEAKARVLTRKPLRPRPEETEANPRARSARLRAAARI